MTYKTKQRQQLMRLLESRVDETFSAGDIAAEMSKSADGMSRSAVYRNLAQLEAEGRLRRVALPGATEIRYQFSDPEHCGAHVHLACRECGQTFHLPPEDSLRLARGVTRRSGFVLNPIGSVLYGVCGSCRGTHPHPTHAHEGRHS